MQFAIMTVLLLGPPLVIAGFWWTAVRRQRQRAVRGLPDAEAVIMARLCAVVCTVLPLAQLLASIVRYKTGEAGTYLWYGVAAFGLLLAVGALASLLTNARGTERPVSAAMVIVSTSMLVLLTMLG